MKRIDMDFFGKRPRPSGLNSQPNPRRYTETQKFIALLVKIFNIGSVRTQEQRKFLDVCGKLYKSQVKKLPTTANIQRAQAALAQEVDTVSVVESNETCALDDYADDLLRALDESSMEQAADPEVALLNKEQEALALVLQWGEFKHIVTDGKDSGEFGFVLHDDLVEEVTEELVTDNSVDEIFDDLNMKMGKLKMEGGGSLRKQRKQRGQRMQRGGGLFTSLGKLRETVCGLFKSGVSSVDSSAGTAVDTVSAQLAKPGFFTEAVSYLSVAGIVFLGTKDPVITLATRIITQLDKSIDMSQCASNVMLFGENVYGLGGALATISPKLVGILILCKVVALVREGLKDTAKLTAKTGVNAASIDVKKVLKENAPSVYESLLKRVSSCLGVKTSTSAKAAPEVAKALAAVDAKSDDALKALQTAGSKVATANAAVGNATTRVNAAVGNATTRVNAAVGNATAVVNVATTLPELQLAPLVEAANQKQDTVEFKPSLKKTGKAIRLPKSKQGTSNLDALTDAIESLSLEDAARTLTRMSSNAVNATNSQKGGKLKKRMTKKKAANKKRATNKRKTRR